MFVIIALGTLVANLPCLRMARRAGATFVLAAVACNRVPERESDSATAASTTDSARAEQTPRASVAQRPSAPVLPPLADSIANRLVFVPTTQQAFVVAARERRLLVDLGRVDDNVQKTPERLAAFRVAAEARSPITRGTRFRTRGPWGLVDATLDTFDAASGRIVGVLTAHEIADSLLAATVVGLAELATDSTTSPPNATSCNRQWTDSLKTRATTVRDSLERALRAGERPIYPRLLGSLKVKRSMIPGCFPGGPALVAVALYGGDFEWVRQRIVVLTAAGTVRVLSIRDYRMRAHELLDAFDADDNGTDDVAARGFTHRAGAQVVLRFTDKGLERIAAGFAWER